MKILVKVKTGAKIELVKKSGDEFVVAVHARPHDGEANEAVIELLADYLDKPKTSLKIVSGKTSRSKIIEIK